MESCIENGNLRNSRPERGTRGLDSLEVVGIVQWRELDRLFDAAQHVVVDAYRQPEPLTTVCHTMTHSLDLGDARYWHRRRVAGKPGQQMLEYGPVIAERRRAAHRRFVLRGNGVDRLAADPLVLPARQELIGIRRHPVRIGTQ